MRRSIIPACIIVLLSIWQAAPAQIPTPERLALESLYLATSGDNWNVSDGWLESDSECDWFGVYCLDNSVVALDLPQNNLQGLLPEELTNLASLRFLGLRGNRLAGSVPAWISELDSLELLDLGQNAFTGSLSPAIFHPGTPRLLWLDNNAISGNIPATVAGALNLEGLWLKSNQIDGEIPPGFGQLYYLNYLWLEDNQLSGQLPDNIGDAPVLRELSLARNQLEGPLPPSLAENSSLGFLSLSDNALQDDLGDWIGDVTAPFPALEVLLLDGNELYGSVPAGLFGAPYLNVLWLRGNQLSGELPEDIQLGSLHNLWLADNPDLGGALPAILREREITGALTVDYENTQIQADACAGVRSIWPQDWTPGQPAFVNIYIKAASGIGMYSLYDRIPEGWTLVEDPGCYCSDHETGTLRFNEPFQEHAHFRFSYTVTAPATADDAPGEFFGELTPLNGGSPQPICGDRLVAAPALFMDRFEE